MRYRCIAVPRGLPDNLPLPILDWNSLIQLAFIVFEEDLLQNCLQLPYSLGDPLDRYTTKSENEPAQILVVISASLQVDIESDHRLRHT